MAYKRISPIPIVEGGTNATSMTNTDGVVYFDGTTLNTTAVGSATQVLTSNGAGMAPTFQSSGGGGGIPSITGDSGGAQTGAITLTGSPSGAVFDGVTGTLTESFDFLTITNPSGPTYGYVAFNYSAPFMHMWGDSSSFSDTFLGTSTGNYGGGSGVGDTGIGFNALSLIQSGSNNTAIGNSSLANLTIGSSNTAVGSASLFNLSTGGSNTAIGFNAGENYNGNEKYNISINNKGTVGESGAIRIGTQASFGIGQSTCFIAGITGVTTGALAVACLVDTNGQLGTVSSSIRFKENIKDMDDVSDAIKKLRPVTFNYKEQQRHVLQYGLIAEEVNEILPELVILDEEGIPAAIKYHDLPVLLLNELQKALKRIEVLEEKLNKK